MGSVSSRLDRITMALQPYLLTNTIPSFESFRATWDSSDELSKSLILFEVTTPSLSDMDDEHRAAISHYLEMMGVEIVTETATLEELLAGLTSDT